jgi:hypothetical protein
VAYEIIAIPTNEAKRRRARSDTYGTAYKVKYFAITAGGHDPNDPRVAIAVDPASTTMPGGAPLFGPEPIDGVVWKSDFCPAYRCRVESGEYTGGVSSVGIFAEVVYVDPSDPDPPALGYTFLFAVANRPLLNLVSADSVEFSLTVFY